MDTITRRRRRTGGQRSKKHQMSSIRNNFRLPLCFITFIVIMFSLSTKAFQSAGQHAARLRTQRFMSMNGKTYQLVLVRHGESTWNDLNKFTGWYDCPLSQKGEQEAIAAGKLLKEENFHFDLAYTSYLQRAIKTLWHTLEQTGHMYIPIKNSWRLNERHYGALQGLDKKETVEKFGPEKVKIWRRSYDIPPPECEEGSPNLPVNDPKYANLPETHHIKTESLKTTLDRVLPLWHGSIAPDIKSGKKLVIAAHGNSLRALVKYLDNISDKDITELNIPTGVPLHYELDAELKPIAHKDAIGPLSGRYIGNQEDIKKRIFNVVAQTK